MTDDDKRLEIIRKLLAKAEANGTTPEERDALAEKAGELMIKYGIDEAIARASASGEVRTERIVNILISLEDVPISYSHEFAVLGCRIAEVFGVTGALAPGKRTNVYLIGFESDVALVKEMYVSLARQCTLNLAVWYRALVRVQPWLNGSQRWNAKRGFITGFGTGVRDKLRVIRREAVVEAGHGAELVLVDREAQIKAWIDAHMNLGTSRGRLYDPLANGAGFVAGQRADVGQTTVRSSVPTRPEIGG